MLEDGLVYGKGKMPHSVGRDMDVEVDVGVGVGVGVGHELVLDDWCQFEKVIHSTYFEKESGAVGLSGHVSMGFRQTANLSSAVARCSSHSTLHSSCSVSSGPPASDVLHCPNSSALTNHLRPATSPLRSIATTVVTMSIASMHMHMNISTLTTLSTLISTKPTTGRLPYEVNPFP